jgi:protocatechuate 3,4-dioxygenase beta subunit
VFTRCEKTSPKAANIESARLGKDDVLKDGLNLTSDAADNSLEITVSQSAASLEGTAYDGDNAVPGAVVHLKAATPNRFHADLSQETVTDQNGHFVFETVTPGSYKAFAQEDTEEGSDPSEPDLQKDGTSVDLGKNERKSIRLEAIKH